MTKKEIEAAIKPEFMAKLKQLRVKTKFMNNIMDPKWINMLHKEEYLTNTLTLGSWYGFIGNAFYWENSPEGYDFWEDIKSK